LNCTVNGFIQSGGCIDGVSTTRGDIRADLTVICAGSESHRLGREVGLRLPIYPLKGYSLTARLSEGSLARSVTDFDRKIVFAPLGEGPEQRVRIAGIADLVGHDLQLDAGRLSILRRNAASALSLDLEADDEPWAGLRPATPDSKPIIGPSGIPGLFHRPRSPRVDAGLRFGAALRGPY
jgi:D-amino-acid dehydrogenase